jgi:hypothetical protein
VIVIVGPGEGEGDGAGAVDEGVIVGAGVGVGAGAVAVRVAVWVTVIVLGGTVVGGAGVVRAGAGREDMPGETAGGGGTVLAGTFRGGATYDEAGVTYGIADAVRVGSAARVRVDAAGLNSTGGCAGDGLGVTGSSRARTPVIRPDSAMVIVAAMSVTAQAASSATQATRYQGASRRTIRGCLPSRRQLY